MSEKPRLYHQSPFPIRLFNKLNGFGLVRKLDAGKLMEKAIRQSGYSDFGEPGLEEPLRRLLESAESEARLHAFGRMVTSIRLLGILNTRLQAQHLFKTHPEILERTLPPKVFITALQRTGTTMLQRLLSADPSARPLYSWEAMNPVPIPHPEGKPDPRIKMTAKSEIGLKYIAPQFFAIHPVEHQAPEEDVLLIDYSLISSVATATMHVPSFEKWVSNIDQTPAYKWHKKMLKLLDWQATGQHWVLKTPHHMEFIGTLFQTYPKAKVIMTHRHPAEIMASYSSMLWHGRKIFSDDVRIEEVTDTWINKCLTMTNRVASYKADNPNAEILDVSYYRLIKDPLAEAERIYDFLELEFTPEVKAAMEATRSQNKKNKYGAHRYQLEDFNLSKSLITNKFSDYIETYKDYLNP